MRSASVHRCIRCSTYRIEAHAESPFEFAVAANLSDRGWRNVWTLAETVWEYGTITCFWFKKLVKRAGTVQSSLFLPKFPFLFFFFFCKLPKVACFQKFAFAKRSAAMKAPVGLLSGSAVCDSRWRGVAPTSATPTRSLRKCRRIEEVKSQWSTTFSRIENLWPRDGSCPLPLRSKRIFNKCFRIVKTQK